MKQNFATIQEGIDTLTKLAVIDSQIKEYEKQICQDETILRHFDTKNFISSVYGYYCPRLDSKTQSILFNIEHENKMAVLAILRKNYNTLLDFYNSFVYERK